MIDWITQLITSLGYIGIALLMVLENIFPPIPSEIIMPLAGFTVTQGKFNFVLVILAGVIGSLLGMLPWYYVGKRVGEKRLRKWVNKHGKWLTLSGKDIDRSKQWFNNYGGITVLFGRLIPGIRTYISIPAGLEEMPLAAFFLYSTIGTVGWVTLLTYSGYLLGQNYHLVERWLRPISGIVITGLIVLLIFWFIQRKKHQNHE